MDGFSQIVEFAEQKLNIFIAEMNIHKHSISVSYTIKRKYYGAKIEINVSTPNGLLIFDHLLKIRADQEMPLIVKTIECCTALVDLYLQIK